MFPSTYPTTADKQVDLITSVSRSPRTGQDEDAATIVSPPSPDDKQPQPDRLPRWLRKTITAVGFTKLYNFILWFITAGALFGFVLARFQYLNFNTFCPYVPKGSTGAAPGECYWYTNFPRYKVGIILHLASILPAGLLAVFQFTPAIRHRFRLYHRMAGYTAVFLGLTSSVGVLMIAARAFGGAVSLQAFTGALTIAFLTALGLAIYNIRMKQIEQHRAWMIRAWVWAGSIITLRIIMIIGAQVISLYPAAQAIYVPFSCNVLQYILRNDDELVSSYPTCAPVVQNGGNSTLGLETYVAVHATFKSGQTEQLAAALESCFTMAAWVAWMLHVIGTEVYLRLTPAEFERLRKISYLKQLEKGYLHPGNAGLTVQRLGDASPWNPPVESAVRGEKVVV